MRHETPTRSARTASDRRARPDHLPRRSDPTTRDTSAGWREEYAHTHVAVPDGGVRELAEAPAPGERVRDRDDEDDELYVVAVHETPASEFIPDISEEKTIAEFNPAYDESSPVVDAVYVEELAKIELDETSNLEIIREAVDRGILKTYSFPADRLTGGVDA